MLRAVAQHWNEIIQLADDARRDRLRMLVEGTAEPDPVEARAALADELLDLLPPQHPVIRVMRTATMFSGPAGEPADARLAAALRWLRAHVLPPDEPRASTAVLDEFDRQVEARLLSLPSLTEDEVRRGGGDPGGDGLIRLPGPDHAVRLPAFQFTPEGRPWPVVLDVNRRLDAAADPWGVACWWVDPHARLAAIPADLLGRGQDDLLRRAAAAIGEEW